VYLESTWATYFGDWKRRGGRFAGYDPALKGAETSSLVTPRGTSLSNAELDVIFQEAQAIIESGKMDKMQAPSALALEVSEEV